MFLLILRFRAGSDHLRTEKTIIIIFFLSLFAFSSSRSYRVIEALPEVMSLFANIEVPHFEQKLPE